MLGKSAVSLLISGLMTLLKELYLWQENQPNWSHQEYAKTAPKKALLATQYTGCPINIRTRLTLILEIFYQQISSKVAFSSTPKDFQTVYEGEI